MTNDPNDLPDLDALIEQVEQLADARRAADARLAAARHKRERKWQRKFGKKWARVMARLRDQEQRRQAEAMDASRARIDAMYARFVRLRARWTETSQRETAPRWDVLFQRAEA